MPDVRALVIDCSGDSPVVDSVTNSTATAPYFGGDGYANTWGVHIPSLSRSIILGRGYYSGTRLHVFDETGALLAAPAVLSGYGDSLGLYLKPSDPSEATAVMLNANWDLVLVKITALDTATPVVSAPLNLGPGPGDTQIWPAGSNPYYVGPGGIALVPKWDAIRTGGGSTSTASDFLVRNYSGVDTVLGDYPNYVDAAAGATEMGDRLVFGIDGDDWPWHEDVERVNEPLVTVLDFSAEATATVAAALAMPLTKVLDLEPTGYTGPGADPLTPPQIQGLSDGSYSMDARSDLGVILIAGNVVSTSEHHISNGRYSLCAWLIKGPGRTLNSAIATSPPVAP